MTNAIEAVKQVVVVLQALLPLLAKLMKMARWACRTLTSPAVSYENLLLDITLDLKDKTGRKAEVTCRQRVQFLVGDLGVVSSPVWGDGNQVAGYDVQGAQKLGEQADGPRRMLLLGLGRRENAKRTATIVARRRITDGFTATKEYFESCVERPTKRLRLTVLFPKGRPPTESYVVSSNNTRLVQPRVNLRGDRARLRWSLESPSIRSVYSLRWSW